MKRMLGGFIGCMVMCAISVEATDFHVTTAQELQSALATTASNGRDDTIFLAAGYYSGLFVYISSEAFALTVCAEPGIQPHEISLDSAGAGRVLNVAASAAANITVSGITLVRNCGAAATPALALSSSGDLLVSNCNAIATGTMAGIGISISAARMATVVACSVTREATTTGHGITISGATGGVLIERNTINGGGSLNVGKGLIVTGVAGTATTIRDNAIKANCGTDAGGGIWVSIGNGTLTMTGNTVSDNILSASTTLRGAGIYVLLTTGTANLANNTVCGNSLTQTYYFYAYGGGVYVEISSSGTATLSDNLVSGNSVSCPYTVSGSADSYGGGICLIGASSAQFFLTGNQVRGNNLYVYRGGSEAYGAGIYITLTVGATATVIGNTVEGNTAAGGSLDVQGGGIYASSASGVMTFSGNTIQGNVAKRGAGAALTGATLNILGNIVTGNSQLGTVYYGGGLWIAASSRLDMINNTVTGNTAEGNGGGAYFSVAGSSETLNVHNNILWGNSADGTGRDVYLAGTGLSKLFSFNCAGDLDGVWDSTTGTFDADPLFYDSSSQDYHLTVGSPCLNVGTNGAPSIPATDIDGEPRIVNITVDIGADEMPALTDTHPADIDANWVISAVEYTDYAAAWKTNGTWSVPPSPVNAEFATRAGYLQQQSSGSYQNAGGKKPLCWTSN